MKGKVAAKLTAAVMSAVMLLSPLAASAEAPAVPDDLASTYEAFQTPPLSAKTRPLWFWNANVADMTEEQIREIMINSKEQSGYAGFGILPFQDIENFMGERYLELYRCALETAKELGMTMCLYDEYGFPSGYAGGQVGQKYPEHLAKRLDKYEVDAEGPAQVELPVGDGTFMGAVLMNNDTKEIIDISDDVTNVDDTGEPKIRSSSTFTQSEGYDATKVVDNDPSTRWNAASNHATNQWIELDYGKEITFDRVVVIEPTDPAVLMRVNEYSIQYWDEASEEWVDCAEGVKIGGTKEHTFEPITTQKVRLFIKNLYGSTDSPTISEFQVYNGEEQLILDVDEEYTERVIAEVPEGNWKVMTFNCVLDGYDRVDYLDAESVDKFIELSYETYYEAFGDYFGTVIDSAFYDEPTFMSVQGGRTWTPRFNEMFEEEYGYNPITLYPALWYDIGEDTAAARVTLHDFRSELFAKNYIGHVNEWCNDHGITLQGHMIYEEVPNPVTVEGDFMKAFKYQDIPGVDMIGYYRYTEEAYKLVSSSAYNWDKQLVMSESYGAINNMPKEVLYKTAMDEYAKGINVIIPHAVWYNDDPSTITFQPELSYRREFADELPIFNNYIGRMNALMQEGRHTADIGVLYPIESLQGYHSFENTATGPSSPAPTGTDYMQVGELLLKELQKDYTWIHPEVLGDRCTVEGDTIKLNNEVNFEEYKVFVMPGAHTISYENLLKIKEFYDNGGKVIATSQLPYQSSEPGHDADVVAIIKEMFGVDPTPAENETDVTVTASSEFESGGYEAMKACDGSSTTRWNSQSYLGNNQWLEVDFGKEVTFNKTITKEAYDRTTSYHIQYWDEATQQWVNCAEGTTIGTEKVDTFEPVTAQKVRLYIDTINDPSGSVSIWEFEVYLDDSVNFVTGKKPTGPAGNIIQNSNDNGGKSYFVQLVNEEDLRTVTDDALSVYDVEFEDQFDTADGNFTYIHKVKDGRDIYFIANSNSYEVDSYVRIRGEITPAIWDPMTGERYIPEYSYIEEDGQTITRVKLDMTGIQSLFIVDESVDTPAPSITVDAPEQVTVNDTFNVSVTAQSGLQGVRLFNESGTPMGICEQSVTDNGDGTSTYSFQMSIGTVGTGRNFTIALINEDGTYTPTDVNMTIDVLAPVPTISSASIEETGVVNVPVTLTAVTDQTVADLVITNEYGLKMGTVSKTYDDTEEGRVWTVTMKIGTAGTRSFNVAAKNVYGVVSEPVSTNPVTVSWLAK